MRTVYDIAKDIGELAPTGGGMWQTTGMRAVPVELLTELREAVEREQRVKVRWTAEDTEDGSPPRTEPWPQVVLDNIQRRLEYAGAWRFDG